MEGLQSERELPILFQLYVGCKIGGDTTGRMQSLPDWCKIGRQQRYNCQTQRARRTASCKGACAVASSPPGPGRPIAVFFSYAHEDEILRDELAKHLRLLERQHIIAGWHDRLITGGTEWAGAIDDHLRTADIILLLVSADFLASDYCYDVEVGCAMDRHKALEARIVPIILREVDWHSAPFGTLQALPKDGRAVTSWPNQDEAFSDIARGIRSVAEERAHNP